MNPFVCLILLLGYFNINETTGVFGHRSTIGTNGQNMASAFRNQPVDMQPTFMQPIFYHGLRQRYQAPNVLWVASKGRQLQRASINNDRGQLTHEGAKIDWQSIPCNSQAEQQLQAYLSGVEALTGTIQEVDEAVSQLRQTPRNCETREDWTESGLIEKARVTKNGVPLATRAPLPKVPASSTESFTDAPIEFERRRRDEGGAASGQYFGMPTRDSSAGGDRANEDLARTLSDLRALRRDLNQTAEYLSKTSHTVYSAIFRFLRTCVMSIEQRVEYQLKLSRYSQEQGGVLRAKIALLRERVTTLQSRLRSFTMRFYSIPVAAPVAPVLAPPVASVLAPSANQSLAPALAPADPDPLATAESISSNSPAVAPVSETASSQPAPTSATNVTDPPSVMPSTYNADTLVVADTLANATAMNNMGSLANTGTTNATVSTNPTAWANTTDSMPRPNENIPSWSNVTSNLATELSTPLPSPLS